jgi:predicted peptidase
MRLDRILLACLSALVLGAAVQAGPAGETPAAAPAAKAGEAQPPVKLTPLDEAMKDPNHKVGYVKKTLKMADGTERIYQVFVPLDYTADKKWPVILFLHGAGECGTDGQKVLIQGLPKEITKREGKFEFIVVAPQCERITFPRPAEGQKAEPGKPRFRGGWNDTQEQMAMDSLKATLGEYTCDKDRVYLTGLSMGGYGTWSFAVKYPGQFAALVPICGAGDPAKADEIKTIPTWVWHGADDGTVAPARSREMVTALLKAGATELRYTEVPKVGHNSWDNTYDGNAVFDWLLKHKLGDLGKQAAVKAVIDAPSWADAPKP